MVVSESFRNAYYIKLGKAGCWEADSIATSRLRLGWIGQSLEDINGRRWAVIEAQLQAAQPSKPQVVTTDLNRLRDITESTNEDVWITFHGAKMWWTRLLEGPVEEDAISKFRRTANGWSDRSTVDRLLVANELPGKLAMLQGFRGTVCQVKERDLLSRTLAGARSELAARLAQHRTALTKELAAAIRELHWKDFETLVDLVFRHAGWERVSVLGQHAKAYDLELREPITGTRYVVQVKSQATRDQLLSTAEAFSAETYRKVFFVYHSGGDDLARDITVPEHVEVVGPEHLAQLAHGAGLTTWLEDKVS